MNLRDIVNEGRWWGRRRNPRPGHPKFEPTPEHLQTAQEQIARAEAAGRSITRQTLDRLARGLGPSRAYVKPETVLAAAAIGEVPDEVAFVAGLATSGFVDEWLADVAAAAVERVRAGVAPEDLVDAVSKLEPRPMGKAIVFLQPRADGQPTSDAEVVAVAAAVGAHHERRRARRKNGPAVPPARNGSTEDRATEDRQLAD